MYIDSACEADENDECLSAVTSGWPGSRPIEDRGIICTRIVVIKAEMERCRCK